MAAYDEDMAEAPAPRVRSTIVRKQKGRGFREDAGEREDMAVDRSGVYERDRATGPGPAKSVEGWVVFVTNLNEETGEDDLHDHFAECGKVQQIHMNLDRRTGYVKGYALIEYGSQADAQAAITQLDGQDFLNQRLKVNWCFHKEPAKLRGSGSGRR